jgi:hypothetical protein
LMKRSPCVMSGYFAPNAMTFGAAGAAAWLPAARPAV